MFSNYSCCGLAGKQKQKAIVEREKSKEECYWESGLWRKGCEPHEHWYEIHRHTQHHRLPSKQGISPYHCLLEVTPVVDVVYFVGPRLIKVTVVIQACDSQAILLLSAGSFYQLWSRNSVSVFAKLWNVPLKQHDTYDLCNTFSIAIFRV